MKNKDFECGRCGKKFGDANNKSQPENCPYCGVKLDWSEREGKTKLFFRRLVSQTQTIPPLLEENDNGTK